jgi:hypothetical protein
MEKGLQAVVNLERINQSWADYKSPKEQDFQGAKVYLV